MKYQIQATHVFYAPRPDHVYVLDCGYSSAPLEFDSKADALAHIAELEERSYHLGHGETGRPDYAIIAA